MAKKAKKPGDGASALNGKASSERALGPRELASAILADVIDPAPEHARTLARYVLDSPKPAKAKKGKKKDKLNGKKSVVKEPKLRLPRLRPEQVADL